MLAEIMDGKSLSKEIQQGLKTELEMNEIQPKLAVVLVGENKASRIYVKNKEVACKAIGIASEVLLLGEDSITEEVMEVICNLNRDEGVNGILVQLPLPKQIDVEKVILAIDPKKDVDGFHPLNKGKFFSGDGEGLDSFIPCTPKGIMRLLKEYDVSIAGKHCVVIGRSDIVGKPTASLLTASDGTVTVCHSKTKNLKDICLMADILVVATGVASTVTADMVKRGAVVVDVGMNHDEAGKLCGDVDFEAVRKVAGKITPVPGGVGPMTIAMLMENCVKTVKLK